MKKDSFDNVAWQQWLSALAETNSYVRMSAYLLDGYMETRENTPDGTDSVLAFEPKSTEDIQSDLQPMGDVDKDFIATYMILHGFRTVTLEDGTVQWAVWRNMETGQL